MNLGGGTGKLRTPGGAAVGDGGAAVASSGGVSWRKKCLKVLRFTVFEVAGDRFV